MIHKDKIKPLVEIALEKAGQAHAVAREAYKQTNAAFAKAVHEAEQARTSFHDAINRYNTLDTTYLANDPQAQQAFDFMNATGRAYADAMDTMQARRKEWMKAVDSMATAQKMLDDAQAAHDDWMKLE